MVQEGKLVREAESGGSVLKPGVPPYARELGELACRLLESQLRSGALTFKPSGRYQIVISLRVTAGRYAEVRTIRIN
jgi:hypothetical protein